MSQKKQKQKRQQKRRETSEIRNALAEQLRLLEKRCNEFDAGDEGEALDMATRLRVIFQTGSGSNASLLQALEATKVSMLSSGKPLPDSAIGGHSLVRIHSWSDGTNAGTEIYPPLGDIWEPIWISANKWYESIVAVIPGEGGKPYQVRRRNIVEVISNKEGGAHFDANLIGNLSSISEPGKIITMGTSDDPNSVVKLTGIHLMILRQIAHETLSSPDLRKLTK